MKSYFFWNKTPCSPLEINRNFGGTSSMPNKPGKKREASKQSLMLVHAGFLLGLFFDHEDGGAMFVRNVGLFSTDYTALYPRRENSSM
jgi:hypothetical protein